MRIARVRRVRRDTTPDGRQGLRCAAAAGALALAGACAGTPVAERTPTADRSERAPSTSTSPDAGTPSTEATTPAPADPTPTVPLALAVHPGRTPPRLSEPAARRLLEGEVDDWADLGAEAGQVRLLQGADGLAELAEDPSVVVAVAATEVTPLVGVATVGGVHPLRRPAAYPLRVEHPVPVPPVVTVTVVGDVMLGRRVGAELDRVGDHAAALRPTAHRLAAADVTVGTLESTLSELGPPTQGDDSFSADPDVLPGLRRAGFDVWSLANNHVGDFGTASLVDTVERLRRAGFATFGAGVDAAAAWRPAVVERSGVRVGFLGFNAIGETPRAGPGRPGAASVGMQPRTGPVDRQDLARVTREIAALAGRVDVVVVMPHWGDQYTHEPVPDQRRVGRALLDAGADVVVGGHPHWVQGIQVHDGRLVVHSLGNFVFDMDWEPQVRQGVVAELTLWGEELKAVELVPYAIDKAHTPRFVPPTGAVGREILDDLRGSSDPPFGGR